MKRLIVTYLLLSLVAVFNSSCQKSNVEEIPSTVDLQDDTFQTKEDISIEVNFLANDIIEGREIAVSVFDESLEGELSLIEGSMKYLYTPKSQFSGQEVFIYKVCTDGVCKEAEVSIQVDEVVDTVVDTVVVDTCIAYAVADYYETETNAVEISIAEIINNDVSNCSQWNPNTFSITSAPVFGNYVLTNINLTYTAYGEWENDEMTYEICNEAGECKIAKIKIFNGNVEVPKQL